MMEPPDPRRVLLVEDNDLIRELCATTLSMAGYTPLAVDSGDAGLAALHDDVHLAVLVTDLHLPGEVDGRSLLDAARRLRPGLGLVVATGAVGAGDDLGPDVLVLYKPFTMEAFVTAVAQSQGEH